jgi:hypothetical protein
MINLELDPQTAVYVMQSLVNTQEGYTYDEKCVPPRIVQIREVIGKIDAALDEAMKD